VEGSVVGVDDLHGGSGRCHGGGFGPMGEEAVSSFAATASESAAAWSRVLAGEDTGSSAARLPIKLASAETATTMIAPDQPIKRIVSPSSSAGATRWTTSTEATASNGVSARIALTREASQCASASAKAP